MSLIRERETLDPALPCGRLRLTGALDLIDRPGIREVMRPFEHLDQVVIDMSGTSYLSAAVLGCLVRLHESRRSEGLPRAINIIGASANLKRTFDITGLSKVFTMLEIDVSNVPFTEDLLYRAEASA